jgi:hypothetical protein
VPSESPEQVAGSDVASNMLCCIDNVIATNIVYYVWYSHVYIT